MQYKCEWGVVISQTHLPMNGLLELLARRLISVSTSHTSCSVSHLFPLLFHLIFHHVPPHYAPCSIALAPIVLLFRPRIRMEASTLTCLPRASSILAQTQPKRTYMTSQTPLTNPPDGKASIDLLSSKLSFPLLSSGTTFSRPGIRFESYPGMGHSSCQKEIDDLRGWLEGALRD